MSSSAHSLQPAAAPEVITRDVLTTLSRGYAGGYAVRFWSGETWTPPGPPAAFTLVLNHPGALRAMFWPKDKAGLGESYIFDDFDVGGDFLAFARWLGHVFDQTAKRPAYDNLKVVWDIGGLPDRKNPRDPAKAARPTDGEHRGEQERESIAYSYDLPAAFYQLFLDPNMQYSCGYFADPGQDLAAAQRGKLDHVCKKLRLKPGDRLLDVGCGWGGLAVHAAKHYGAEVVGITLAAEQAAWARTAAADAGLTDRVSVVLTDYRDFKDPGGFDKAVSVGMGEHVRPENLLGYMATVHDALRPGGAFLYHVVTLRPNTPYPVWTDFSGKYVFPNGRLHTLVDGLRVGSAAGFEVRDVENLREHYTLTLRHWCRRLEARRAEAVAMTDEVTYRIYRLYMAAGALGFEGGEYHLNQTLFAKPDGGRTGLPLTRADWYA